MNQKHQNAGQTAGALVPAWIPGDQIDALKAAKKKTGESRSFLVAECVRLGLPLVLKQLAKNGKSTKKKTAKKR